MIRDICKDILILQRNCQEAGQADIQVAVDLLETLQSHSEVCVGMAANMIGVCKRIIAFHDVDNDKYYVMLNPEIIKTSKSSYKTEEGCLSLSGQRMTRRYDSVKVQYQDLMMHKRIQTFHGFVAQIIQHEIDHCNGILI